MLQAYTTVSTGMRLKLDFMVDVMLQELRQEWLAIKCLVQITEPLFFWRLCRWIATLIERQLEKTVLEANLLTNCRSICTEQPGHASRLHLGRVILRRTLLEIAGRAPRSIEVCRSVFWVFKAKKSEKAVRYTLT